jgi:hypothetical protein
MRRNRIRTSVMLVAILLLPLLVLPAQDVSSLLIGGRQGQASNSGAGQELCGSR